MGNIRVDPKYPNMMTYHGEPGKPSPWARFKGWLADLWQELKEDYGKH